VRSIGIIALILLLLAGVSVWLFEQGYVRFNYPDRQTYPVWGIDVSHHQGDIDWHAVAKDPNAIQFVFMKATEGGDFKDTRFAENWRESEQAGIMRGAYHFFTFCKPGLEQAANFIDSVPVEKQALPPVIDFEFVGNCQAGTTTLNPSKEAIIMAQRVQQVYQQPPIFYVTYAAYERYLKGKLTGYPIWIRDIFRTPSRTDWTFWQFSNRGRIAGIKGPVDLNVFYGTQTAFQNRMWH
jgi:lysozyme